ncbi:hypothetical protein DPSP01_012453 [Paraphaeosphaeria sporulosa]|uniref:SRR1-like domain-containing protein n=1 Tax=Paraphaeosphaeria sporulosa TaxID=1460663 RepID=A0A177CGR5_9PLEO|nr:uncharacterized protein CC84DRAFT_786154 [Paraphaeosphaeria sporulosa]OAG06536.1 hypothetical protein CC84DRAFT_786154 [Paraphaeosphaeria sporulosa]
MALWDDSVEQKYVFRSLRKMVLSNAAQITNIICIGHGSLRRSPDSMMQHIAVGSIAKELSRLYEELGKPLQEQITILAQDPSYTENDKDLLARLPVPVYACLFAMVLMAT